VFSPWKGFPELKAFPHRNRRVIADVINLIKDFPQKKARNILKIFLFLKIKNYLIAPH